jgi:hypothetical protein
MAGPDRVRPPFQRLTVVAGAALVIDALVLALVGLHLRRPLLVGIGLVSLLLAMLLYRAWRGHQRRWAALTQARHAVRDEARAMAETLRRAGGSDRPGQG